MERRLRRLAGLYARRDCAAWVRDRAGPYGLLQRQLERRRAAAGEPTPHHMLTRHEETRRVDRMSRIAQVVYGLPEHRGSKTMAAIQVQHSASSENGPSR